MEYEILRPPPRRRRNIGIIALVIVIVGVATGAYLIGHAPAASQHTASDRTASTPGTAGRSSAAGTRPLSVMSTVPASGATNVPSDQVVTVTLSAPVAGTSGLPVFNPPVAGTWKRVGPSSISFSAAAPFIPTASETMTIPAGATGVRSASGAVLAAPVTTTFVVAQASTERLQQLLAQLDYLPVSFTPTGPVPSPAEAATAQPGTFAWRWPDLPPDLTSLWIEGSENVITKGALMTFQSSHGLEVDAIAGTQVWTALLADSAASKVTTAAYTDVLVSKQVPETLTVYQDGAPVMANVAVNTGAPGADTADGTFPVFEHVPSSRMQGTNPDGSTYDDPDVPWASYFNGGDALHGFVRATYGTPQSNGCVEMPVAVAAQVWPLTPVGTLVTVIGPPS